MKKYLLGLLKNNNKISEVHCSHAKKTPKFKTNEHCLTCKEDLCFSCTNNHYDNLCEIEWGVDLIPNLKKPYNEVNIKFNLGYPFILNLEEIKCPCGTPFLESNNSSICSACGTATCSSKCHHEHLTKTDSCCFDSNFFNEKYPVNVSSGLRSMRILDFLKAIEYNYPPFTRNSSSDSKFMSSYTGEEPFHIILQRGFRQYGQPHLNTLNTMIELEGDKGKEMFNKFSTKLCNCDCEYCTYISPHPEYNCFHKCLINSKKEISEEDKLKEGFYKKCNCSCSACLNFLKDHRIDDCYMNCVNFKQKRH